MRIHTALFFFLSFLMNEAFCQVAPPAAGIVVARYEKEIGTSSPLFNGTEYYYDDRLLNDHAFFVNPLPEPETVVYDGVSYPNVKLSYDILRDVVVTLSADERYRVKMVPEKVLSFTTHGNLFIRIYPPAASKVQEGFFQVLHDGKSRVLAKRRKVLRDDKSGGTLRYNVINQVDYVLEKNGKYFNITDRESALAAYDDKSAEMTSWLKTTDYNFRTDKEPALVAMAVHYDQITANE